MGLNLMFPTTIVMSLLFIPVLMLVLSALSIFLDQQINNMLIELTNRINKHQLKAMLPPPHTQVIHEN